MNEELQIENGQYTRIVNRVIEELSKAPLLGAELSICLFIIRKTYGYQKKQDEISLTQFEEGTKRSRPTIVKALKNLQLVNMVQLVKKGDSKKQSNCWSFNKYYETWKLVKHRQLVKKKKSTSKEMNKQLVKTGLHTKENIQKKYTKEIYSETSFGGQNPINMIISLFKGVNPFYGRLFPRRSQRAAVERLIQAMGEEKLSKVISLLPFSNRDRYGPNITTPLQLEEKMGQLMAWYEKNKNKSVETSVSTY